MEAHSYNVKRRGKTFWYHKLASRKAIFEPLERTQKTKVLHITSDDDPRNVEARVGVERCNQLE